MKELVPPDVWLLRWRQARPCAAAGSVPCRTELRWGLVQVGGCSE